MGSVSDSQNNLSRREREVINLVFTKGSATVGDIHSALTDHPSYAATRMVLQRLHKKGALRVHREGKKYIYSPAMPKEKAGATAFRNLLDTFFTGSASRAVSALLGDRQSLSDEEIDELEALIKRAKEERQ